MSGFNSQQNINWVQWYAPKMPALWYSISLGGSRVQGRSQLFSGLDASLSIKNGMVSLFPFLSPGLPSLLWAVVGDSLQAVNNPLSTGCTTKALALILAVPRGI